MRVINIAFAGDMDENSVGLVAKKLKMEIEETGRYAVGLMDTATTKDEISAFVASNKYDVIICQEKIREVAIGAGSIKQWKKENGIIKIILLVDIKKRGGDKLKSLLKDAGYYNALYFQDASGINLVNLFDVGRSREAAISYYGLEGRLEDTFSISSFGNQETIDALTQNEPVYEQPMSSSKQEPYQEQYGGQVVYDELHGKQVSNTQSKNVVEDMAADFASLFGESDGDDAENLRVDEKGNTLLIRRIQETLHRLAINVAPSSGAYHFRPTK